MMIIPGADESDFINTVIFYSIFTNTSGRYLDKVSLIQMDFVPIPTIPS